VADIDLRTREGRDALRDVVKRAPSVQELEWYGIEGDAGLLIIAALDLLDEQAQTIEALERPAWLDAPDGPGKCVIALWAGGTWHTWLAYHATQEVIDDYLKRHPGRKYLMIQNPPAPPEES
jgi:hypothetical protein